jgi:toxin ParE1/3/4
VNLELRFEAEAEEEYRAAARWYDQQAAGLGTDFLDCIDTVLHQISQFPDAGAPVPRVRPGLPVRRAPVKRFPYHVVYLKSGSTIRILAVAHDRQRPGYWKQRA